MTIWFNCSASWQPLSSFSECLSAGDAMPCLLWAAVMWVRSISVGLSVWLHSSMLSTGRTGRSPQYRPEHTPPRGTTEGQSWGKVNIKERSKKKGREGRRERPGQSAIVTLCGKSETLWVYFQDTKDAWRNALQQNNFKNSWSNKKNYKVSGTN